MAIDLVDSNCDKIIKITTVIGTLITIPVVPQIIPQKTSDKILNNGLIFIELPSHLGSIKLPIITCIEPTINRTVNAIEKSPNCNKQNTDGNMVPNSEPIDGIYYKMNIKS
mgnify:CR=1 FL=1